VSHPRWIFAAALIAGLVWIGGTVGAHVGSDFSSPASRFRRSTAASSPVLKWTFVRIKYNSYDNEGGQASRLAYWDEPWAIDAPAAEQNLTRRIKAVTAIDVSDPIVMTLEDPKLWEHPWIYMVEPSNLVLKDTEVPDPSRVPVAGRHADLRRLSWSVRVAADGRAIEARVSRPRDRRDRAAASDLSCFYRLDKYPQIPGLGSFLSGRTWEKGGFTPHLRGILDDKGRPMVLINWNTDMGDGVEWSNAQEYQGYVKWTAQAYQMLINEVIYSLTH
jgi:hypothetical protein